MIEALARIRNDSVLSRPGKKAARGPSVLRRLVERARALPFRVYVGAVLSALLAGIGVNALILQRERHPAPLFAPPPPKFATPGPVAPPPPAPASTSARDAAPSAAARPSPPARSVAPDAGAPRPADAIGDLLRGEAPADNSRLVATAQTALAKLGYPVKADGAQGAATDQGLRDFEHSHGLPISTEITPHLVKLLSAAARSAAR